MAVQELSAAASSALRPCGSSQVRLVVAGTRGRRQAKLPDHVRPTKDLVREAMFSSLTSRFGVDGAAVVDLYCGSGAMGIEAVSRGAVVVHVRRRRRVVPRCGTGESRRGGPGGS